jgi:hypothetical protein
MRKLAIAVSQRLAFKAASAHRSPCNDDPTGIPFLDPSLATHIAIPSMRFDEPTIHPLQPLSYAQNHTLIRR